MAHAIGVTGPAGLMVAVMAGGGAIFSSFEGLRASKSVQQMILASNKASSSAAPSTFLQIQSVATPVKPPTTMPPKRSKVEIIKEHSNYLRYPLKEELETEAPNVNEDAIQLIKFHGSYQQDNRELRGPGHKAY